MNEYKLMDKRAKEQTVKRGRNEGTNRQRNQQTKERRIERTEERRNECVELAKKVVRYLKSTCQEESSE